MKSTPGYSVTKQGLQPRACWAYWGSPTERIVRAAVEATPPGWSFPASTWPRRLEASAVCRACGLVVVVRPLRQGATADEATWFEVTEHKREADEWCRGGGDVVERARVQAETQTTGWSEPRRRRQLGAAQRRVRR